MRLRKNVRNWKFVCGVLRQWEGKARTLADAETLEEDQQKQTTDCGGFAKIVDFYQANFGMINSYMADELRQTYDEWDSSSEEPSGINQSRLCRLRLRKTLEIGSSSVGYFGNGKEKHAHLLMRKRWKWNTRTDNVGREKHV